jgi:DNA (cytosine-5)-methyltransferase 1
MFLVGVREDCEGFPDPPRPTHQTPATVRAVLADLPRAGSPGNSSVCPAQIVPAKKPVLRPSPYAGMLFNGTGRPLNLDAPAPTLPASMGGNRTPIIDQYDLEGTAPSCIPTLHSQLLDPDRTEISVPSQLRRITVEEAASLQSFPADVGWVGPQTARYRQIGNAVPPKLALAAARAIRAWYSRVI